MNAVRFVAIILDLLLALLAILVGFIVVVTGDDGPWWLLPFGLIYLLTFGAAGRQLWRWLNTSRQ